MNTKTMRLPPRRVLTPNGTTTTTSSATTINNNKRKEREKEKEVFNAATITKIPKTATARAGGRIGLAELVFSSNRILAGYLAHEFLTRGTLFGQQWDPTSTNQNEAVSKKAEEEKIPKPSGEAEGQVEEEEGDDQQQRQQQEKERYVELANLLKTGGAHLAGIVNPTQLTHFLHKKR
ncbi:uncharacterized protein LOC126698536 [Quercus robur]|uniref:uncharacterized protein LOC126698536 n=1 Tax=Quercus robur TaxID=38942 RepID=UPI002162973C|nr:uncharacterized protein LOC126698536 [Quercus robur]